MPLFILRLDRYASGDLVMNGRSTKDFKDRDWDAFRSHFRPRTLP